MVIRLFGRHSLFTCLCILAAAVIVTMAVNLNRRPEQSAAYAAGQVHIPPSAAPKGETPGAKNPQDGSSQPAKPAGAEEMRAVWIPYFSLDMSGETDKSEQAFQKKFDGILQKAKGCGMNTLIVQVRPFGDALYPSSYFPWSHVVGGTQGVSPGYDPLADMVKASHGAGLKIQAWVNPLRIQTSSVPSILAEKNPYNTFRKDSAKKDWVVDFQEGKYYNPAYEPVRKLVADGVREIVQKYDVDGVQFDDYFYPTRDPSFDRTAYAAYCASAKAKGTPLGLLDWRRGNINALVSLVYREIKSVKPDVPFGIAPQGNVQNDRNMGADVDSWCAVRGYVDYICPQLYYNFQNPVLPFNRAAQTWRRMVTDKNIKLYFGLALYKAGSDADSGTWKKAGNILATQVKFGREVSCDGFMFYSSDYLKNSRTKVEVQNVMKVLHS